MVLSRRDAARARWSWRRCRVGRIRRAFDRRPTRALRCAASGSGDGSAIPGQVVRDRQWRDGARIRRALRCDLWGRMARAPPTRPERAARGLLSRIYLGLSPYAPQRFTARDDRGSQCDGDAGGPYGARVRPRLCVTAGPGRSQSASGGQMRSLTRAAVFFIIALLTIATAALAQRAADYQDLKARAPFAHLAPGRRSIAFGIVKQVETKFMRITNTGTADAEVTVVGPLSSSPFTVVGGGCYYSLAPKQVQMITVQFAPTAKGRVTDKMTIQCANCNTAADDNIVIQLAGNARGPVVAPTPTASA